MDLLNQAYTVTLDFHAMTSTLKRLSVRNFRFLRCPAPNSGSYQQGLPTAFLGDLRIFYQNPYRPRIGMITLFTRLFAESVVESHP